MKNVMQKKFFIPLIAVFVVLACIVTAVCVLADKEAETMNTRPETNESASESVKEPVSEPITEPPTEEPTEPQPTEPKTEPTTEPQTTAPTEPVTEPITEAQTEPITEAPTVPPTEPVTETPTEPEIEFMIKARDTAPDGEPIEFNVMSERFDGDLRFEKINSNMLIAPIINGTEYDQKRAFTIFIARSSEEFESNFSSLIRYEYGNEYPSLEKYTESYFEKNALIILYYTGNIEAVVKNGAELCISNSTVLSVPPSDGECMITVVRYPPVRFIEVSKADLDGIDTVSFFVEAKSTQ